MSEFVELDNGDGKFGMFRISEIKWVSQLDDGVCEVKFDEFTINSKAIGAYEDIKKILNPKHQLKKIKKSGV